MKICMLCYRGNPYSGGQGIYLKYVSEELVRQGHDVHVIVGPPYPPSMNGVTMHYIHNNEYYVKKGTLIVNKSAPFDIFRPLNAYEFLSTRIGCFSEISAFSFRAFMLIRRLIERIPFDVIHDNQCLGYGLLLMREFGVPVIATIHHPLTIDLENAIERASSFLNKMKGVMFYPILMQQIVSKRLDHIITVSHDSRSRIAADFGVPMEKQTVVYNGLDTSIFHPIKGIRKRKGKLLFVGNVEDGKKGFVYLAKALQHVRGDVKLSVVDGGSPHRKVTGELIRKLKLLDRIELIGKATTEQLVRHYCESEIAIVPSTYEGFGFPAAEAMACGVPVIASDGGALPEVVGDAGVIVPSRDDIALADAIDSLMADRKKRTMLAAQGKERVIREFNWPKAVGAMVDVYKSKM